VVEVTSSGVKLVSDNGELYVVAMQPMSTAKDTVVRCAVRRDRIELANTSQPAATTPAEPNTVYGTVEAIEYQGSYVKVTIHRSGHEDVIAHLSDRAFFSMQGKMGDRVVARWSVADVHLLHAEHGLIQSRNP
jgi:hypothetical protein